jgi:hypothetical protein
VLPQVKNNVVLFLDTGRQSTVVCAVEIAVDEMRHSAFFVGTSSFFSHLYPLDILVVVESSVLDYCIIVFAPLALYSTSNNGFVRGVIIKVVANFLNVTRKDKVCHDI